LKSYDSLPNAVQGTLRGEVDLLPIDKIDIQTLRSLENSTNVRLVDFPSFDFTYIGVNLRSWPLNDLYLRKAMLYAFNRPRMLNQVLGNFGESLGPGLFSSAYSIGGWPVSVDEYNYNPTLAKTLLENEGFNQSSTFRIDPLNGQTLKRMFINSRLTQPADVAVAELFAKEMQAIGLPIVSFPMQDLDFYQSMRTYSFDIFIDSQSANSAPTWLYNLFDSENNISPVPLGTNLVGYANSTFDSYVKVILTSGNQNEVRNAAIKCQEILAAELPVLPVFSKHLVIAARSGLPIITTVGSMSDTLRNSAVNIVRSRDFSPPLRVGFGSNFDNLDPTTSSNAADWTVLRLLTEPLFTLDQQGKLKPNLAQQWTLSNDGTLVTISMRQNAKFYNGQSITVNDLVTTLNWLINNVQASSPLYPIVKGFTRIYVLDQKTFRIVMSKPDRLAISSFTNLFALPGGRLVNSNLNLGALKGQLLVASGPFVLREFTQTDGVYMRLNEPYFGRPVQNSENFEAFEGEIFGTPVLGSEVNIRSSLPYLRNQPVRNASYRVCTYDQDGVVTQCDAGKYEWPGSYSATLHLDYKFRIGTYRVEGVVYGTLPSGAFIIFEEKTMSLQALPLLPIIILAVLILVIGVMVARGKITLPRRLGRNIQRRGSRRKVTGKRSLLRRRILHST